VPAQELQQELPESNTLQRGVAESFNRAVEALQKYQIVQSFRVNAEGLLQQEESSIMFIESLTQYYQTLEILEVLQ
jgi:hypothetical protein